MATSLDQTEFVKTALRLPPKLHALVQAAAEARGMSINTLLVRLIQDGLERPLVGLDERALADIKALIDATKHN